MVTLPARRLHQRGDDPQQRCLAGPVGANQRHELPFRYVQVNAAQDGQQPVAFHDSFTSDHWRASRTVCMISCWSLCNRFLCNRPIVGRWAAFAHQNGAD
jgi:hypothetical protein